MSESPATQPPASTEELAARLSDAVVATFDLFSVYLGGRLGYYQALQDLGSATAAEVAAGAGADERYTREWLEQQAVAGLVSCTDARAAPDRRRYALPPGHAAVLLEPLSPTPMAARIRTVVGALAPLQEVMAAYRSGAGVPFERYGADLAEGQAASNRSLFARHLVHDWLPAMPDVDARLRSAPPARVADLGSGHGWSSIELAKGYPQARIDGFDLDPGSVAVARRNARAEGVADRVSFEVRDAGDPALAGEYDLALAIECVHDMADPVAALGALRRLVGSSGTALVVDELTDEQFAPGQSELERSSYGFSLFHCLPVGRAESPSAATGTVMRPAILRRYAAAAGFAAVEILPIDSEEFFFYRLRPPGQP